MASKPRRVAEVGGGAGVSQYWLHLVVGIVTGFLMEQVLFQLLQHGGESLDVSIGLM